MTIDTSTAAAATGASKPETASQMALNKLGSDYDSFLKLLTAQVSNQDPLAPMDSTTFVSQLAQLSQVEQSVRTNTNLEEISARLASAGAMSDVQLIGRDVTLATDRVELAEGAARYDYQLSGPAASVSAVIRAADGTVLRTLTGLPGTGGDAHEVTWDGKDKAGLVVPDGSYRIEIKAEDAEGEAVGYSGRATTQVNGVSWNQDGPVLELRNGDTARSSEIRAVF
ncbi:MAG: flagellar hook assembly protein FlgD [Tranquillimonas sp.]